MLGRGREVYCAFVTEPDSSALRREIPCSRPTGGSFPLTWNAVTTPPFPPRRPAPFPLRLLPTRSRAGSSPRKPRSLVQLTSARGKASPAMRSAYCSRGTHCARRRTGLVWGVCLGDDRWSCPCTFRIKKGSAFSSRLPCGRVGRQKVLRPL